MSRRGIEENVKPARAWVPSHITGFFAAHRREEPHLSGSVGCGLCLSSGASTIAEPAPELERTEIFLNRVVSRKCCNFKTALYPTIITPRPSIDTFCP